MQTDTLSQLNQERRHRQMMAALASRPEAAPPVVHVAPVVESRVEWPDRPVETVVSNLDGLLKAVGGLAAATAQVREAVASLEKNQRGADLSGTEARLDDLAEAVRSLAGRLEPAPAPPAPPAPKVEVQAPPFPVERLAAALASAVPPPPPPPPASTALETEIERDGEGNVVKTVERYADRVETTYLTRVGQLVSSIRTEVERL